MPLKNVDKFLVPSLLPAAPAGLNGTMSPDTHTFYMAFGLEPRDDDAALDRDDLVAGFLPGSLFTRLIGRAVEWSQRRRTRP